VLVGALGQGQRLGVGCTVWCPPANRDCVRHANRLPSGSLALYDHMHARRTRDGDRYSEDGLDAACGRSREC
jgi:hypothetical protein